MLEHNLLAGILKGSEEIGKKKKKLSENNPPRIHRKEKRNEEEDHVVSAAAAAQRTFFYLLEQLKEFGSSRFISFSTCFIIPLSFFLFLKTEENSKKENLFLLKNGSEHGELGRQCLNVP